VREALEILDGVRRSSGEPTPDGTRYRHAASDGRHCLITFSDIPDGDVDRLVLEELTRARDHGYVLEWDVYAHDSPKCLPERLLAAGFEGEPKEDVLVLRATEAARARFVAPEHAIRRIDDIAGLEHVAEISREIGRSGVEAETERFASSLRETPDAMSIYVAYLDEEPVACGRIAFLADSRLAMLCGGRTKTTHRRRGLYTALVHTRLGEAIARRCELVMVEALPTSQPILVARGFASVSCKQELSWREGA
jgi:hypothetical protein